MNKKSHKLTFKDVALIHQLQIEGLSFSKMGERVGISPTTVGYHLDKEKYTRSKKNYYRDNKEKINARQTVYMREVYSKSETGKKKLKKYSQNRQTKHKELMASDPVYKKQYQEKRKKWYHAAKARKQSI